MSFESFVVAVTKLNTLGKQILPARKYKIKRKYSICEAEAENTNQWSDEYVFILTEDNRKLNIFKNI